MNDPAGWDRVGPLGLGLGRNLGYFGWRNLGLGALEEIYVGGTIGGTHFSFGIIC